MIEVTKSILLDFLEVQPQTGVPWRVHIEAVPRKGDRLHQSAPQRKVDIFQVIQRFLETGVPRENPF